MATITDLVTPGEIGAAADNRSAGFAWGHSNIHPWIVSGVGISGSYSSIDTAGVNSFAYSAADSTGLTAVFDGGEGFVHGWLVRDRQTSVDLPADSTTTVYVGYDPGASLATGEAPADSENIILGPESAFATGDPKVAIYDMTTDGSSITGDRDFRRVGREPIEYGNWERAVKVVTDDSNRAFDVQTDSGLTRAHEGLEVLSGPLTTEVGVVRQGSGGLRMSVAGDGETAFIAPYDSGSWNYSRALEYRPARGEWDIEGTPRMRDGLELEDIAGAALPADTKAGRLLYDSSREQ